MNTTKPNRRWFRFNLRTLFVVVTLFGLVGVWMANQMKWIRDRKRPCRAPMQTIGRRHSVPARI